MKMKLKVMSVLLLFGVFSLFILSSCVDMPTKGPTPPPALSYYRFIHAAEGAGSLSFSLDGSSSIGPLDFKGNTSYGEYNAGTRMAVFPSTNDTLYVAMSTDYRGTFCVLKEGDDFAFFKANEMRVFDPNVARLRFINLSADAPAVDVAATGSDTTFEWTGVGYKQIGGYKDAIPGDYTVTVTAEGDTVLTFPVTVGNERSTAFIMGSVAGGTLSAVALKDN